MDPHTAAVFAKVKLDIDENLVKVIEKALKPEAESPSSQRSMTRIEVKEKQLLIQTWATDVTALRASLNSYLRWIDGIQNMVKSIQADP